MKLTSIPFCKEIPDNWQEIPNKYLFEYHSSLVGDNWKNYQLLSLTTSGVKEKDINAGGGKVPDSYDKYQTVEPGDIVFCLFDLDVSAVFSGLSHNYGMITSAYDVVRAYDSLLDQSYCDFWFQYVFSDRYYKMYSKNIRFTIGTDMFKSIKTPVPPIEVQERIGAFLNKKTLEIDSLIEIENKQIEKLKEYKQAIITETVTKGLDKNTPMKDSGIQWIGKIPITWCVSKVNFFYDVVLGKMLQPTKKNDSDTLESYLCAANVGGNKLKIDDLKQMWFSEDDKKQYKVNKGDLLVVEGGDVASSAFYNSDSPVYIQNALHRVRSTKGNLEFLRYYLMFIKYSGFFEATCNKATIAHFTKEKFCNLPFLVPANTQVLEIIRYLNKKCLCIDSVIELKQTKIDKLNEYKKSLIFEYVTGKKEVMA